MSATSPLPPRLSSAPTIVEAQGTLRFLRSWFLFSTSQLQKLRSLNLQLLKTFVLGMVLLGATPLWADALSSESAAVLPADVPPASPSVRTPLSLVPLDARLRVTVGEVTTLEFLAIDAQGTPLSGWQGSAVGTHAQAGAVREVRPGIYAVEVDLKGEISARPGLVLRLESSQGQISRTFSLELTLKGSPYLRLTSASPRMRLGVDREQKLLIEGRAADGSELSAEGLRLFSNLGRIERLRELSGGRLEAVYVPGDRSAPYAALLVASWGEGDEQQVAATSISMIGSSELPVETEPRASVSVEIGAQSFGPVVAGSDGVARVPIQVGPGVDRAVVKVRDTAGNMARSTVDLSIPHFSRVVTFPDRQRTRTDDSPVQSWSLVSLESDGALSQASPISTCSDQDGKPVTATLRSPGWSQVRWEVPPRIGSYSLLCQLIPAFAPEQSFTSQLVVEEGIASRIELSVSPSSMRTGEAPATVQVRVLDRAGQPASGVRLSGDTPLGFLEPLRMAAPGTYVSAYHPPDSVEGLESDALGVVSSRVQVRALRLPTTSPAARLEIASHREFLEPLGTTDIFVRVTDARGLPVADQILQAATVEGQGGLPARQVTDAEGWAAFPLSVTALPGVVRLQFALEGRPAMTASTLLLVTPVAADLQAAGMKLQTSARPAPGTQEVLTASAALSISPGRIRGLEISAFPNVLYSDVRQTCRIRIVLHDALGQPVVDPDIQVTSSLGILSAPVRQADGSYAAELIPPRITTAMEVVRLEVSNPRGEYSGATEVRLLRKDAVGMGSAKLGLLTTFFGIQSPVMNVQVLRRLPVAEPHLYVGAGLSYFYWSGRIEDSTASVRLDYIPIGLQLVYRQQFGRLTPSVGLGSVVCLNGIDQTLYEGAQRVWGVMPGLSTSSGLEYAVGPGGLSAELQLLLLPPLSYFDNTLTYVEGVGALSILVGYNAHF